MMHCCVWGLREADIITAHRICSNALSVSHITLLIWSQKVEMWDMRACQMWNRMLDFFFVLEDVIKHYTLAAAMSQQHVVKYFSSYSSLISRSWISAACLLCFPSLLSLPIWYFSLSSNLFPCLTGLKRVEYALFLPTSLSLYLPFLLSSLCLSPSVPKEQL